MQIQMQLDQIKCEHFERVNVLTTQPNTEMRFKSSQHNQGAGDPNK